MLSEKTIDIKENDLLKIDHSLLEILLKDRLTSNNILQETWQNDPLQDFTSKTTSTGTNPSTKSTSSCTRNTD